MNRGVWVAALALGLGGAVRDLGAQETIWRPVQRPPRVAPKARASSAAPSVQMGRPVPILRGSSGVLERPPRLLPPEYRGEGGVAYPPTYTAQAIATVPPPGSVIAASAPYPPALPPAAPATPPDADPSSGDLFAVDRGQRALRFPGPLPGRTYPSLQQAANWRDGTYPAEGAPVPPALPVPPTLSEVGPPAAGETPLLPMAGNIAPAPLFWARAEYLLWWLRRDHAPPLLTTGDANKVTVGMTASTNPSIPGALDQPDTVVIQDGKLTRNPFSGARFFAGVYLDECGDKALEVGGFFLGSRSLNFQASSAQFPVLARPFFAVNPNINMETVNLIGFPGFAAGNSTISAPTQLWGLESNFLCNVCCGCDYRINALAGFRYLNLRESLTITEDVILLPADPQSKVLSRLRVLDSFATSNDFYGGQVGVAGRWFRGRFFVDGSAKVALGVTHESVTINGAQLATPVMGPAVPTLGGLLAQPSNIGTQSRDRFSVVPELYAALGYSLTDNIRVSVGYNFLYWSDVVRPGQQIDRNVDVTQIQNFKPIPPGTTPGIPLRPLPLFKSSDFWAQGLTVGLEFSF